VSVHHLEGLFEPRSVAVVGASDRPGSVGAVLLRNLLTEDFPGPIMPVNPGHRAVGGVLAYPDVASLPERPDLGVVCTPPGAVPGVVADLAAAGARAAVIVTAGLSDEEEARTRAAARRAGLRLLGPNTVGLLVPGAHLNASFAHAAARPGRVAFVSQSGALCTAVLDWAELAGVGFSAFVSLGNGLDVDAGDALDWLGADPATQAILLYLEAVEDARKFMSAARAGARNKPVIAIKAGRVREGARAAASHTGALAGADEVYDAAFRRAGMLRVGELEELFGAAEILGRSERVLGDRLTVLTNGGGPGVMATDRLVGGGGRLAALADGTVERLDAVLPPTWSRANPVDVVGDATEERYADALRILLDEEGSDAILVLHAPTALASSEAAARAVAGVLREAGAHRPVLTSWMGGSGALAARRHLREAGVPTYRTPAEAVSSFLHLVAFRRNQELLMETPPSVPEDFEPDAAAARAALREALGAGHEWLGEAEAKRVLAAYGIPVVETRIARDADEAERLAAAMGLPAAVKILSPDVTHKSDVGGVALDLETPAAVGEAARAMTERLARLVPDARLEGFTVQAMARRPHAFELIVGAHTDPVFGPVILFGEGGTAIEVIADRALGLPPLNVNLARALIDETRVARRLRGYRDRPAVDMDALVGVLLRVSQLLVDHPEIDALDVNPLLADEAGVVAVDARVRVTESDACGPARLAIRPYPRELEETVTLADGERLRIRPIRPEDEPAHERFLERLAPGDVYFRFFSAVRKLSHSQMARYTQIDYDREMAFIAHPVDAPGETLGVVRVVADPDNRQAEFAIVVRSDRKGRGLGRVLLEKMIRYCRSRGTREMVGQVLGENRRMQQLARELGFELHFDRELGAVRARLPLG